MRYGRACAADSVGAVERIVCRVDARVCGRVREESVASADDGDLRMTIEEADLALDPLRGAEVVGVHSRDVLAPRHVETPLEAADQPEIALVAQDLHAVVGACNALDDGRGVVRGAVLDDDQFE